MFLVTHMVLDGIPPLAHRKQKRLTEANIPDGTVSIGDAAFSLCPLLKQVVIPASVEYIGVAAFCASGLEEVAFHGVPKFLEPSIFAHCEHLKRVLVPIGSKSMFDEKLPSIKHLISEGSPAPVQEVPIQIEPVPEERCCRLNYNQRSFTWKKGDNVQLSELFSGPTALIGNPSYQFRRKCLFVFMKSQIASAIIRSREYSIPANTANFTRRYKDKYGTRDARIFLFICDDGKNATFYDEVRFKHLGHNSIIVQSNL